MDCGLDFLGTEEWAGQRVTWSLAPAPVPTRLDHDLMGLGCFDTRQVEEATILIMGEREFCIWLFFLFLWIILTKTSENSPHPKKNRGISNPLCGYLWRRKPVRLWKGRTSSMCNYIETVKGGDFYWVEGNVYGLFKLPKDFELCLSKRPARKC